MAIAVDTANGKVIRTRRAVVLPGNDVVEHVTDCYGGLRQLAIFTPASRAHADDNVKLGRDAPQAAGLRRRRAMLA